MGEVGGGGEGTGSCHPLCGTQPLLRGYEGHSICDLLCEQQAEWEVTVHPQLLLDSLFSPVLDFCPGEASSSPSLTRPNSHTGSLPRACRGHSPPWAALMLECWMCGIAGGSVQPRPLGEDEHLIGMLATLGEAERGEIKRSLL